MASAPTPSTPGNGGSSGSDAPRSVPATVRAVAVLVAIEALAVLGFAVSNAVVTLQSSGGGHEMGLASALFLLLVGLALGLFAYGLLLRKTWMRAAVVVAQLLMLPIGWQLLSSVPLQAGAMLVTACAVLVLLFMRPSTGFFSE